jgi:hypothetical protein
MLNESLDVQEYAEQHDQDDENDSLLSLTRFPLPSASMAKHSLRFDQLLFFMAGLGSSLGYIASLSSLVFFQQLFGDDFFVSLNLAVYVPLVPISIAQALWDQQYDQFYATQRTFVVRGVISYSLIIWGTITMILLFRRENHKTVHSAHVLLCAFLQGAGGAIMFGQLNQLASFMTTNGFDNDDHPITNDDGDIGASTMSNKFKAAVSAGVQASALVLLLLSWTSGFGTMNADRFVVFLWSIVLVTVVCFACLLWLLLADRRVRASMVHRDSFIGRGTSSSITPLLPMRMTSSGICVEGNGGVSAASDLQHPLLSRQLSQSADPTTLTTMTISTSETLQSTAASSHTAMRLTPSSAPISDCGNHDPSEGSSLELSVMELWTHTGACCLILAMTLVPSFLVGSWFTHVKTSTWMQLPQVLFYVRIGADFLGRLATLRGNIDHDHVERDENDDNSGSGSDSDDCSSGLKFVMQLSMLRWGIVGLFFFNATVKLTVFGQGGAYQDAFSIGLVAIIAFLSGYLVTSCYLLAPLQLPAEYRVANGAKQASLLTVAFAVSALVGLLSSFALALFGV